MKKEQNAFRTTLLWPLLIATLLACVSCGDSNTSETPVFESVEGILAIEAEDFLKQTNTDKRKWYITDSNNIPDLKPDSDPAHLDGVSGGAYVEVLPDSRHTHDDEMVHGENFSDNAGEIAVLHYNVHFNTPGRYFVWMLAYSSNSEDDSYHVGLDGEWPYSGTRWRTLINDAWGWQRLKRNPPELEHEPATLLSYIDVESAGPRELQISMREDGGEIDKIVLALDEAYEPVGLGPDPKIR